MNSHSVMIFFILALSLSVTATLTMFDIGRDLTGKAVAPTAETQIDLVNVIATNISNGTARHIRITVTSDEPVRLNDTLIRLRTQGGIAELAYRNGTLERNETSGFYTNST